MSKIIVESENRDHRKGPSIWPWILGALLLFGLIWAVFALIDDDEPEQELATTTVGAPAPVANDAFDENATAGIATTGAIAEFIRFAEEGSIERENVANVEDTEANAEGNMGLEHEYTSEGIDKLSAALYALADNAGGDEAVVQSRDRFAQKVEQLQKDPQSLEHANLIRETFVEASGLISTIKERSYPDSDADVDELQQAAEAIEADKPTLEQKDQVEKYFDEAAEAMEEMTAQADASIQ